jgi:hypothetical protein
MADKKNLWYVSQAEGSGFGDKVTESTYILIRVNPENAKTVEGLNTEIEKGIKDEGPMRKCPALTTTVLMSDHPGRAYSLSTKGSPFKIGETLTQEQLSRYLPADIDKKKVALH